MNKDDKRDPYVEEVWRTYFTTGKTPEGIKFPWFENPGLRALARHLPSEPRCRLCYYPFGGLGGKLARSFLHLEPSRMNPYLCNVCERFADSFPGGVELEITLLFADIRGSTPLAETMDAYEFSHLIDQFYQVTTNVIYDHGGMVEKLVGDEITAFFPTAMVKDNNHAAAAIKAGQEILKATGHSRAQGPWVPVGVGVNTGEAFVGAVGEAGKNISIAVLGDTVNIAARLTGQAQAGELIFSEESRRQAGLDASGLESRHLQLKGKIEPMDAWIYKSAAAKN